VPGHIICASCPCGFEAEATPGFKADSPVIELVMACSPNKTAERTASTYIHQLGADELLATLPKSEAQKRGLEIIKDPALEENPLAGNYFGPWSGYKCPLCGDEKMTLTLDGFWN
jgi:hypothetical protein